MEGFKGFENCVEFCTLISLMWARKSGRDVAGIIYVVENPDPSSSAKSTVCKTCAVCVDGQNVGVSGIRIR